MGLVTCPVYHCLWMIDRTWNLARVYTISVMHYGEGGWPCTDLNSAFWHVDTRIHTTAIGTPSECVTVSQTKFTNCFIYKGKKWLGNVLISVTIQTSYWHSCNGVFSWTNQISSTNQFERALWKYVSCMHLYELNCMMYAIPRLPSLFLLIKTSLVFLEQCNAIYQPSY